MLPRIFSLAMLLNLTACDFDLSPWETDVDCPGMSIESNLQWLAQIEQNNSQNEEFKVAVIGDPQQYPGDLENTIDTINNRDDIDFIVLLGDLVETGIEQEFEWSCKALSKRNKPVLSVVGNHDALSFGQTIWVNIFGDFDYSFYYKDVKFIAYNDNQYEFVDVPDREWLASQAQLAANEQRRFTIGMSHIEPWGRDPDLSSYLHDLGFDHMLHAHNHRFSFWQQSGLSLPHFVVADTEGVKYAVMHVQQNEISMQQCTSSCVDSEPTTR